MAHKFNSVLQQKADEEKEYEKKQEKLKNRFGIQGRDVVVVEKTNTFKFTVKTLISLVILARNIILVALALVGILALCYPAPRAEVMVILEQAWNEIVRNMPVGLI